MKRPNHESHAHDIGARFVRGIPTGLTVLLFVLAGLAVAQRQTATSYDLRVSTPERGLLEVRLLNNQGTIVVYLPDGVREGEPFSGTFNPIGTVSSTATYDYSLELGEQHAKLREGAFHWKMPEKTGGHVRLRFTGYYGEELAVLELPVVQASDAVDARLPGGETLHLPGMIQSGLSFPVFGPSDGDSSATSVKVAGQNLRVLTEVPGKAIIAGPNNLVGMSSYEIKKGALEEKGEVRVINIEQKLPSPPERNGKTGKLKIRVTGLTGVTKAVPIRFEITPKQDALFEPTPPYAYSPSPEQHVFIEPKEVRADGSYVTARTIMRIIPGLMNVSVQLEVPQDLRDIVEIVLRTPRRNYSHLPEQEHAEDLKPYGDAVLPVLADLMVAESPDQGYAAYTTLFYEGTRAAPFVLARIPRMRGQPLGMALDAYSRMAVTDPLFAYRKELREAILELVVEKQSWGAIEVLGKIGAEGDIPLLEDVYHQMLGADPSGGRVRDWSNAALARLGVKQNIDNIARELEAAAKIPLDDVTYHFLIERAVYADRKELLPYLCLHIYDPAKWFGDSGTNPGGDAMGAIVAIEHTQITMGQVEEVCKTGAIEPAPAIKRQRPD
jgi:hypothetical protein